MKVLVLSSLFPNSLEKNEGAFVFKEIKELSKLAPVKVIAPIYKIPLLRSSRIPKQENWEGIEIFRPRVPIFPFLSRWLNGLAGFVSAWGAASKMRRHFAFDVIYAHFVYPDGFAGVLLGKYFKVPVVLCARGSDIRKVSRSVPRRAMTRWALKEADKVLCVSKDLKERILKLASLGEEDVVVNYNGVDLKGPGLSFHRSEFLARYGLMPDRPLLLSVGHFVPLKNHLLLIEAMRYLKSKCQLVIIGGGPLRRQYEKRKKALGLNGSLKILGPFSEEEITRWYEAADLLIHPSLSEGLPNVVLEAMAMKRPVVASRVGGLPEVIEDGKNGCLFAPLDSTELIRILDDLIQRPQRRREMGQAGFRSLSEKAFTWKNKAQKTASVLNGVLAL